MSNTPPPEPAASNSPPARPFRAQPAAFATVVGGLLNIYLAFFKLPYFAGLFHQRLAEHPLPAATALLLDHRWVFMVLACLWPVVAIGALWTRRAQRYIVIAAILIAAQVAFSVIALYLPILGILQQAQGGQ